MLGTYEAVAMIAVRDLEVARKFYEGTLGLKPLRTEGGEVIVFQAGGSKVNVYRSEFAGTNKATALVWSVGDNVDGLVRQLRAKGVTFEHYAMPGLRCEGDVHIGDGMKVAWFKDPDGNILSLVSK